MSIRTDRKKTASSRIVGGGVSIIYRKSTCNFKERKIAGNAFELVMAVGKIGKIARQIAVFCVYIEPRTKMADLAVLKELIENKILKLKANSKNPIILLGGDMNRRDLASAFENFDDIKQINHDATRRGVCLDMLFSNADIDDQAVWPPLESRDGRKSDHDCVIFMAKERKARQHTWGKKWARKHTSQAVEQFGLDLRTTDWNNVLPQGKGPDHLVASFETWVKSRVDKLFPVKSFRSRTDEPPWITQGIRWLSKLKSRVCKREGKV